MTHADPLAGGFYTVREAARLLQIESGRRVAGWLAGHHGVKADAVIRRDYEPIGGSQELSFSDLMEVRFINHFRRQGVPLQTLRKIAQKARNDLGQKHPFALSNVKFMTDRKRVFSQVVEETGCKRTLDILGDQYEMYDVIETVLAKYVAFHSVTGLAEFFKPLGAECPNVVIDPRFAYGKPVISDRHIPTAALFRQLRAEKGDIKRVAQWYKVEPSEVEEAAEFETRLAN
jgi:uncharacterized protein (DUF433 family)